MDFVKSDPGLDVLLELNDTEYTDESGYWYKIEAYRVDPTKAIPHGIRYNLTLHNRSNQRIMGFDNAHAVKPRKRGKYKGRIVAYDHMHKSAADKGTAYAFSSAQQLIEDFFNEVNRILKEVSK
ncbi:MAG: DUF6516 family protein [Gammaproteobacteria bacterium]|nr:DUF6516 family protein [Gammaproteobacteria bacterium]